MGDPPGDGLPYSTLTSVAGGPAGCCVPGVAVQCLRPAELTALDRALTAGDLRSCTCCSVQSIFGLSLTKRRNDVSLVSWSCILPRANAVPSATGVCCFGCFCGVSDLLHYRWWCGRLPQQPSHLAILFAFCVALFNFFVLYVKTNEGILAVESLSCVVLHWFVC